MAVADDRAPSSLRRTVLRALTVAGVSAGAWLAFSMSAHASAQGPLDDVIAPVSSGVSQVVSPVVRACCLRCRAGGVAELSEVAAPAVSQVSESLAPGVAGVRSSRRWR